MNRRNQFTAHFSLIVVLFVLAATEVYAGATYTVNTSEDNAICDDKLTLREAFLLADEINFPRRVITSAEREQISGDVQWVQVRPGCSGPGSVGWSIADGTGANFSDNIVFTNDVSVIYVAASLPGHPSPGLPEIGINDHINGRKPNGSIVALDGSNAGSTNGLTVDNYVTSSNIRNLEIRNFAWNGIYGLFENAVFEGLIIHHNGLHGIYLGFSDFYRKNPRNNRIGNANSDTARNFIYGNGQDGIHIAAGNFNTSFYLNNVIENTYVGYRNSDVNTDDGNGRNGITLNNAWGNRIGYETGIYRNFIGGNDNDGIYLLGSRSFGNRIINNVIGRQSSLNTPGSGIGNTYSGVVLIEGAGGAFDPDGDPPVDDRNYVGERGKGNVISGNRAGVFVSGPTTAGNAVQGNYIGTNFGANDDVGNQTDGVFIGNGASRTTVGGETSGEGNVLAYNRYGIYHQGGTRNYFLRNRLFLNERLGFDLAPAGVTANDTGDGDTGPNNLVNYPVLNRITGNSSSTTITGTLNSAPNKTFTVEFFGNSSCHANGHGEGRTYLGKTTVSTDSSGNGTINVNFLNNISNAGQYVTATSTGAEDGTSEFSRCTALNCSYSLSATSMSISSFGGPGSFTVSASNAGFCPYQAISSVPWITVTTGTGNGSGTVNFAVARNDSGLQRTGTISVAGQTYTVTQRATDTVCTYSLSPTSTNLGASGGSASFSVITQAGCEWAASDNTSWIATSSAGTGNGTVNYTVSANNGAARSGTITVAGQNFTVNQASGCSFTMSPASQSFSSGGGTGFVDITSSAPNCVWTTTSGLSWVTVTSGSTLTGSGRINYTVAANTGPARSGPLNIHGQNFTINQATGCSFTFNPAVATIGATGGSGSFTVSAAAGCAWSAVSNAPWIRTTSAGSGSGTVNFTVDANAGAERSGTITVGGRSFTVTQSTSCLQVSIPTGLTAVRSTTLTVPVNVTDTTGRGIIAYDFTVTYDPGVLTPLATPFDKTGTLSQNFTVGANAATTGLIRVSGYGTESLNGNGVLLNLKFNVNQNAPLGTSNLLFAMFRFNEDTPCAVTSNGSLQVIGGTISGTVIYATSATPVNIPNVTLTAAGTPNIVTTTAADGTYILSGLGDSAYTVTPSKTRVTQPPSGAVNGITTLDASRVHSHVLGTIVLNSYQQTAGDASGNGTLTAFDAALIAQYAILLPNIQNVGTWKFAPPSRTYASNPGNQPNENYIALLIGDVTGDWNPSAAVSTSDDPAEAILQQTDTTIPVSLPVMSASPNRIITIPVSVGDLTGRGVMAYQFELLYDPNVLQPLQGSPIENAGTISESFSVVHNPNAPGRLLVGTYGGAQPLAGQGTLLNLRFQVIGEPGSSSALVWRNLQFNEGDPAISRTDGRITVSAQSGPAPLDFDGDGKSDLTVFRPSEAVWHIWQSASNQHLAYRWGLSTDKLTPADFDGDGRIDLAVWRSGGLAYFYVLQSSTNTLRAEQFGQAGDDPSVVADFDGDGRADPAVYRNAAFGRQSFFFYRGSLNNPTGGVTYLPWGINGDEALRGDFDGDGQADLAVYRPNDSTWYIRRSSDSGLLARKWGLNSDRRLSGDFDGDGKTDFAVFRSSEGLWYILQSGSSQARYQQWGISSDHPLAADFDGDGKSDIAVFRGGAWYILNSGNGSVRYARWGLATDIVP